MTSQQLARLIGRLADANDRDALLVLAWEIRQRWPTDEGARAVLRLALRKLLRLAPRSYVARPSSRIMSESASA